MWLKKTEYKKADWEEVPDEDLWEDGELTKQQVEWKVAYMVLVIGDWKLVREVK